MKVVDDQHQGGPWFAIRLRDESIAGSSSSAMLEAEDLSAEAAFGNASAAGIGCALTMICNAPAF